MRPVLSAILLCLCALHASAEQHLFFLASANAPGAVPELAFVNMKDYPTYQCLAAVENLAANAEKQSVVFIDGRCVNTFYQFSAPTEDLKYTYLLTYPGGAPNLTLMSDIDECYRVMTESDKGEMFCGRSSQRITYP